MFEENKDQAFFRQDDGEGEGFDIENQKKKNERRQAILRQTLAEEEGRTDYERVKPQHETDDPYKDSVDNLPVGKKRKWRIW